VDVQVVEMDVLPVILRVSDHNWKHSGVVFELPFTVRLPLGK
jgi:hypothetical protein